MTIQGIRHTDNFVTDQRPKNWREGILMLEPNGQAPLTGLTSGLKNKSSDDPEFNWWTKSLERQRLQGDTDETASTTTFSVTGGATSLVQNHLLLVEETGEIVRVSSDPSSDGSIPVERGFSGTSAASFDAGTGGINPNLIVIGTANEENASAPTGLNFDPVKHSNYTQIFRNALEASRTAMKTRLRTGDAVKEAKRETAQYHSIEMERALFWGQKWEGTMNGNPVRTTGGIKYWMDANASDRVMNQSGASTDMEQLEAWMDEMFRYGSSEKMAFVGNKAMLTVNQIVRKNSHYNINQGVKEYGMNVTRLDCPFGSLVLKTHPLFNYAGGGTHNSADYYGFNSSMYVLDMDNLVYRYLEGSDTSYLADRQPNDLDGKKSEFLTECGLELHHPETHFIINGLTNPAADS
jgi:hypothetical protein